MKDLPGEVGVCGQNLLHNCPTTSYTYVNEYFLRKGVLIMNVTEAISKRISVRSYENKPIPPDILKRIVEAGQWAPNAGPFQISVILNAGLRQKINDRAFDIMVHSENEFARQRAALPGYQPVYGAPVLILLSAPADAPFGPANTALAAENMLLEATGLGLGSCYLVSPTRALNGESNRDLAREAGVPEGYTVQCALIVGYAAAQNKFGLGERKKRGAVNYIE
ncbi:MAG: nitroreductase [Deltaproteobacteria bacterium]|nr:nitroreductase [Deltaproteobacteria bacterium]